MGQMRKERKSGRWSKVSQGGWNFFIPSTYLGQYAGMQGFFKFLLLSSLVINPFFPFFGRRIPTPIYVTALKSFLNLGTSGLRVDLFGFVQYTSRISHM